MADPAIKAELRARNFQRAAEILGVEGVVPSTKDDVVHREAYLSELILKLAEHVAAQKRPKK